MSGDIVCAYGRPASSNRFYTAEPVKHEREVEYLRSLGRYKVFEHQSPVTFDTLLSKGDWKEICERLSEGRGYD